MMWANFTFHKCDGWLIVSTWVRNTQHDWLSVLLDKEGSPSEGYHKNDIKRIGSRKACLCLFGETRVFSFTLSTEHCLLAISASQPSLFSLPWSIFWVLIRTHPRWYMELQAFNWGFFGSQVCDLCTPDSAGSTILYILICILSF